MDPDMVAPVVVSIVFMVSTAAVLIFRPLAKRFGDRIAASKPTPTPAAPSAELVALRHALEDTSARLELLEQRLDFTERLLASPTARASQAPAISPGERASR
jgi:hypothetical protein